MPKLLLIVAVLTVSLCGCATPKSRLEWVTEHFERIRGDADQLADFMRRFPKGGDIHHHLIGAPTPEMLIDVAIEQGFCMQPETLVATAGPCVSGALPVADALADEANRERLIDRWSMRGFTRGDDRAAEHFFGIFPLIWPVVDDRGELLARLMTQAASENVAYLETQLQVPAATDRIRALALSLPPTAAVLELREALVASPDFEDIVSEGLDGLASYRRTARSRLGCEAATPPPACAVKTRFQIYALRILPLSLVYADMILAYELAERSELVAAVNVVGYEGDATALMDYRLHIEALAALGRQHPGVKLALHAGEITAREADAAALGNHVPLAVYTAQADRIGHGAATATSDGRPRLLADLKRNGTTVELSLTSNEFLLGLAGDEHPLPLLWRAGVPIVLATDDAGIFRTDLSREFALAAQRYPWLRYRDFKTLARWSLEASFLEGDSLWANRRLTRRVAACAVVMTDDRCTRFRDASAKATAQWALERSFDAFENGVLGW